MGALVRYLLQWHNVVRLPRPDCSLLLSVCIGCKSFHLFTFLPRSSLRYLLRVHYFRGA